MKPNGIDIFNKARLISPNIAYLLPRTSNIPQIVKLCKVGEQCEVEQNYLSNRMKTITVYYGNLIKKENTN
jgi:trimethylguanosine synthase